MSYNQKQLQFLFRGNNSLKPREAMFYRKFFNEKSYDNLASSTSKDYNLQNTVAIFNQNKLRSIDGIINEHGIILQPKRSKLVSSMNIDETIYQNLDFVVRAFENMKDAYSTSVYDGTIQFGSKFLSDLNVYKGFVDPFISLENHLSDTITYFEQVFRADSMENTAKVVDFATFIPYAFEFLKELSKIKPLNYSTLLLSDYMDLQTSGLMIDIANIPTSVDWAKISNITNQPNFLYYKQMANNFGFNVIREMPSKLILDLNSKFIFGEVCVCGKTYSTGLTLTDKENIIKDYFEPAFTSDLNYLFDMLHFMYDRIQKKLNVVSYSFVGKNGGLFKELIRRPAISREEKTNYLDDAKMLYLYVHIKNYESKMNFNNSTIDNILKNAMQTLQIYDMNVAMEYINKKFSIIPNYRFFRDLDDAGNAIFSSKKNVDQIRLTRYDYKI
jgi:hypothetical protein